MHLKALYVYPVKSLAGFSPSNWEVAEEGLLYDRKWMLVDEMGNFCTQRKSPQMSQLQAVIDQGSLLITRLDSNESIRIPLIRDVKEDPEELLVWSDKTAAFAEPEDYNNWLSDALEMKVKLYRQTGESHREHSRFGTVKTVSFADSQPFLVVGTASLADLNFRLDDPVDMNRFRPNLVVETAIPFIEDNWNEFQIGDITLKKTKLCGRCKMVNVNQETGMPDRELLKFLSGYRKNDNSVDFGIRAKWANFQGNKTVEINQPVTA